MLRNYVWVIMTELCVSKWKFETGKDFLNFDRKVTY